VDSGNPAATELLVWSAATLSRNPAFRIKGADLSPGVQIASTEASGAFHHGDISAAMLNDSGSTYGYLGATPSAGPNHTMRLMQTVSAPSAEPALEGRPETDHFVCATHHASAKRATGPPGSLPVKRQCRGSLPRTRATRRSLSATNRLAIAGLTPTPKDLPRTSPQCNSCVCSADIVWGPVPKIRLLYGGRSSEQLRQRFDLSTMSMARWSAALS